MISKSIVVKQTDKVEFHNAVDFCVGTGRMGLALQKEYQEQLKLVQDMIGFKHIRGHGLFCDDMAIYQEHMVDGERVVEYNFTYLDLVMDSYKELGIKPFLELGFMPKKMASGTQTVFYWKGNTTPPKSYEDWKAMVQALLVHLMERYGKEEVLTWPIEVWNEPNLPGFWKDADMQEYFVLFQESYEAVKQVDERFCVGGPAVCGGSDRIWMKAFLEFCRKEKLYPDFISRHHYATKLPDAVGHYGYAELLDPENEEDGFAGLHATREIVDSFEEYRGLPIHITEFNTSYIPNCPLHDTNQNAAYIAQQLSRLGDDNESYSYWTFGDIFEEFGVPYTPFHGGFGLVANGCIPKPTFWSFVFFKNLKKKAGNCVYRDHNCVIIRTDDGGYRGVAWNAVLNRKGIAVCLDCSVEAEHQEYSMIMEWVDEKHTNPLKVWHDLGEPASLSESQKELLQNAAKPFVESKRIKTKEGTACFSLTLEENAVVYFELAPSKVSPDRGYHYERVMQWPDKNPITRLDYPDVDVIRVEDTYYMVSTTMYFMPGCEILRSYDLVNWEHAAYVYDRLDGTQGQTLSGEEHIYGKGMWAASLRYHKGCFYVCFVANDTGKTYLYMSQNIEGPWEKRNIEGFYHDCSLLFDDDDKVYLAYGNKEIYIVELKADLSGPKPGGLNRLAVSDKDNPRLGYEGAHFYKINGKYYLFFIHSLKEEWKRVQACFVADSLEGEFTGGDILNDDMGYWNQGVAQGGIVDTPDGNWYSILFQDRGAVGRIPVLIPMSWKNGYPVLGEKGKIPEDFKVISTRPDYAYEPLVQSDDFKENAKLSSKERQQKYGSFGFKSMWQFNHEPDLELVWKEKEKDGFCVKTDKLCANVLQAKNVLTQRMLFPGCAGEITIDAGGLNEGDYAGLCALQDDYGLVGITKRNGALFVVMQAKNRDGEKEYEAVQIEEDKLRLRITADFADMKDEAKFYYKKGREWVKIGITHQLRYSLSHFTGYRFGLFVYSTEAVGGCAGFSEFEYRER